jgi:hypothetical protein
MISTAVLLSVAVSGQCYSHYRYLPRRYLSIPHYTRAPDFWHISPLGYSFAYSVPRTYRNRPRQISPSHRRERLAWERKKLSPEGREDQLNARIRALKMRGWEDEFSRLDRKSAILWYKMQTRANDPNWGGKWKW